MTTPRGSPELTGAQAVPETTVNEQIRRTEAGACHFPVTDRVTAPPGSCADGANYLIIATATGAFTGKEGQIATAAGTNAASGWYYHTPIEGFTAWVMDENTRYLFDGSIWGPDSSGGVTVDTDASLAANSDALVASQKATKTYVDNKVAGLSWKQAVRVATTTTGTLSSSFENGDTVDGVTLATGDRILLKNQSSATENGIYTVNASGSPTRTTDADTGGELVNASVYVSEGTVNADTQWTCTTNAPITLGSTSLAFVQLTSGGLTMASTVGQTGTPAANSVGFLGSPQMSDQDDYTLGLADSGGHYYHVSATPHTLTIPANASIPFPIGTVIVIVNENGAGNITVSITSDTLRWGSSTGSRTIAANGTATLLKVDATVWRLTGDGIT